uniref:Protein SRG1-like n=1 Tax=Caenorhabditis tropicalis TaxID=1561998 RepID=A0A1I7URM3_9PELO
MNPFRYHSSNKQEADSCKNEKELLPFENLTDVAHDLLTTIDWEKIQKMSVVVPIDDFCVDDDTTILLGSGLPLFEEVNGVDPCKEFRNLLK